MYKGCLIGLGGIGNHHAEAMLTDPRCEIKYICDVDESKIVEFNQKNNIFIGGASWDKILNDPEVSFISIATFDDLHFVQVMEALAFGKHVFVEKPLCQTRNELLQIKKSVQKNECNIASNLVLRTSLLFQDIKEKIHRGVLGEIYAFDAEYLYGRLHKIVDGWRKDTQNYSVMEGGGIHMIDLILELTGQLPSTVSSVSNKIVTKDMSFKYEDYHACTFQFLSGLVGRVTANFGCVHKHQHIVRIYGTKATFIYDDMGARIHWARDNEERNVEHLDIAAKPEKKALLIHEFIDNVDHKSYGLSINREINLMSVTLAAVESLNSNNKVIIEYM